MRVLTLLLITSIISTSSFAQTATLLEQGEPAPFTGTLVTNERVDKLIKAEKKVIVLEDLRITQEQLIEFHKDQARVTRRKLTEAKYDSYMNVLGAFFIGVLATSVAIRVNKEVMR